MVVDTDMGYIQRRGTYRDGVHTDMGYIHRWGTYRDGVHTDMGYIEMVYIQRWG